MCIRDSPCTNFEEYEIKIQCIKTKLHSRYIAVIAIGICIWQFSGISNGEEFVAQFSFASTITSIVLSVLAIIMSISGEGKTEHIKDQLQESVKNINISQKKLKKINNTIVDNLEKLNQEISNLHTEIEKLPENVAQQVEDRFIKSKSSDNNINVSAVNGQSDFEWFGE